MVRIAALMVVLIGIASSAIAEPKPFAVEDAINLARPITDRDPGVHSLEVRGHYPLGGPLVQVHYWYETPDRYGCLMAVDAAKATFFAALGSHAIFYDPRRGELLVFNVTPGIRGVIANNSLQIGYTFSRKGTDTSPPPGPGYGGVFVDVPSLLRTPDLTSRELQPLGGSKYRLVLASTTSSIAATIDPSASFAYTDIEIVAGGGKVFFEMHVNRALATATPRIPDASELRESIAVEEESTPSDLPGLGRLLALQLLPLAAMSSDTWALAMRKDVEYALGEKPDWVALEANWKRDIPKLQKALPLPKR